MEQDGLAELNRIPGFVRGKVKRNTEKLPAIAALKLSPPKSSTRPKKPLAHRARSLKCGFAKICRDSDVLRYAAALLEFTLSEEATLGKK